MHFLGDKRKGSWYYENMSRQEMKEILHNIDFRADNLDPESVPRTVSILINLVERLSEENEELKIKNQKLRDENNRLKGEQLALRQWEKV